MLRRILAALAVLAAVTGLLALPHIPPRSGGLRVASANLLFDNPHRDEATEALLAAEADVLALVEWTGANASPEALRAAGLRPVLDAPRRGTYGVSIWVRDGIEAHATLEPAPIDGPCPMPVGTARVDGWTVLAVHAPPPVPGCEATTLPTLRALAARIEEGRLTAPYGAGRAGDPVLVMGDLNALPWLSTRRIFADAGLSDAHAQTSWRIHPTWPALGPLAVGRIDYVFAASTALRASGTFSVPGSDHRGVLADLRRGSGNNP